jgi:hypothetical protein
MSQIHIWVHCDVCNNFSQRPRGPQRKNETSDISNYLITVIQRIFVTYQPALAGFKYKKPLMKEKHSCLVAFQGTRLV